MTISHPSHPWSASASFLQTDRTRWCVLVAQTLAAINIPKRHEAWNAEASSGIKSLRSLGTFDACRGFRISCHQTLKTDDPRAARVSTILSNAQQKKGLSKVGYLAYTSNPIFALVLEVQLYHLHLKRFLFEFHLMLSCYANSGYFLSLASCFGDGWAPLLKTKTLA